MNMDGQGDDAPPVDASTADAFEPPVGYTKLISGTWTLPAGTTSDEYLCVRLTIPNDTYLTNIIAQAPLGTHHTVLSISDSNTAGPDGQYTNGCGAGELGMVMLYASGVGTSPLDFPQGVGVKITGGTQIHLNLHLFNATDKTINGESGIFVKSQSTPTPTLAEMVFAGKFLFAIPGSAQGHKVTGGCTSNRNFTMFALWPHMHQIAVHSKFELIRGGTPQVLHDMPYDFNEQTYYKKSPEIQVMSGDQIRVTCTYNNPTNATVTFGESSNQEMCFTGMYRYPAGNAGLFECTDNPNF